MASAIDVCSSCRTFAEIVQTEEGTGRSFCSDCSASTPLTPTERALAFIELTTPFQVGDRVEARTAGTVYDGIGIVREISIDVRDGGTPVFPSFRVELETREHDKAPDVAWYTEICLRKVQA